MTDEGPKLTWRETRRLLREDMDAFSEWPRAFGTFPVHWPIWLQFIRLLVTAHMFPAVVIYRLQTYLYDRGIGPIATMLSRLNHTLFGVSAGHHVRAGGGLYFAHGHVVMDGIIRLGRNVQIAPFVTLGLSNSGARPFTLDGPTIGDHVNIGTGAKVLGPVHVGDGAKIGANAVVVRDVPAGYTAVGVPARNLPPRNERETDAKLTVVELPEGAS
ncbi:MAG: hypothetical protein Kow0010_02970 [Dehalococcoidia bacterium]